MEESDGTEAGFHNDKRYKQYHTSSISTMIM
jgi:hypothetical protein